MVNPIQWAIRRPEVRSQSNYLLPTSSSQSHLHCDNNPEREKYNKPIDILDSRDATQMTKAIAQRTHGLHAVCDLDGSKPAEYISLN